MSGELRCPVCGGPAFAESGPASSERYRCKNCGHLFDVRAHYVEEQKPLGISVYKALVNAGPPEAFQKTRLKVRRIFQGRSNFSPEDLDKQIAQQLPVWDLGFYSEDEVKQLRERADEVGFKIDFVRS